MNSTLVADCRKSFIKYVVLRCKSALPQATSWLRGPSHLININMWSSWKSPTNIQHWTDTGSEFTDGDGVLDTTSNFVSSTSLYGVSMNYEEAVNTYGTKGLVFTGFGFDTDSTGIISVEVEIKVDRLARIVDERVQLWRSELIGSNVADTSTENTKTYSGDLGAFWGAENIDPGAAEFGVLLDFAPRSDMPSSNRLVFRSVRMRVFYSSS
jgi:hypothetical protein